eukprot:jgi/Botrbrau1/20704/Bobra.0058s0033.1
MNNSSDSAAFARQHGPHLVPPIEQDPGFFEPLVIGIEILIYSICLISLLLPRLGFPLLPCYYVELRRQGPNGTQLRKFMRESRYLSQVPACDSCGLTEHSTSQGRFSFTRELSAAEFHETLDGFHQVMEFEVQRDRGCTIRCRWPPPWLVCGVVYEEMSPCQPCWISGRLHWIKANWDRLLRSTISVGILELWKQEQGHRGLQGSADKLYGPRNNLVELCKEICVEIFKSVQGIKGNDAQRGDRARMSRRRTTYRRTRLHTSAPWGPWIGLLLLCNCAVLSIILTLLVLKSPA